MLIVIGTQLRQEPRFWDKESEWYLPQAKALMVTYADFHKSRRKRQRAMEVGLREYLNVDHGIKTYLDNGAFSFSRQGIDPPINEYIEFVENAKPDWYPVPTDYIPQPQLSRRKQKSLFNKTMTINRQYGHIGFVPVMHAGDWLNGYLKEFNSIGLLSRDYVALGGLVPRLLSSKGSSSRREVVDAIKLTRSSFKGNLHIFGIGGLGTLHLAAALKVDSIDSVGWRNRAARGLILLPGRGERSVVPLGNWRGKELSKEELEIVNKCECPACTKYGLEGLRAQNARDNHKGRGNGASGFNRRAIHNLWTILKEAEKVEEQLNQGTYKDWHHQYVSSPILSKLIEYALNSRH